MGVIAKAALRGFRCGMTSRAISTPSADPSGEPGRQKTATSSTVPAMALLRAARAPIFGCSAA